MLRQIPGKIFLADQRGLRESFQFRRYCTLSFEDYADAHKGPVGRLMGFNEETLAGGHSLQFAATQPSQVLLLPVTGAVQASGESAAADVPTLVDVEQVMLLSVPAGETVRFTNPYAAELVTFLHLWLAADARPAASQLVSFAFQALENQLVPITPAESNPTLPFALYLGRFAGRQEAVFALPPDARFFAFALAGAFEVEGRLLHEKDALALWQTPDVEIEALSNHALLLVLRL